MASNSRIWACGVVLRMHSSNLGAKGRVDASVSAGNSEFEGIQKLFRSTDISR